MSRCYNEHLLVAQNHCTRYCRSVASCALSWRRPISGPLSVAWRVSDRWIPVEPVLNWQGRVANHRQSDLLSLQQPLVGLIRCPDHYISTCSLLAKRILPPAFNANGPLKIVQPINSWTSLAHRQCSVQHSCWQWLGGVNPVNISQSPTQ